MRAKIENLILPDYVLCYKPRGNGSFGKIWENLGNLENFGKFWEIFGKISKILENFGKFRIIIAKVGVKL